MTRSPSNTGVQVPDASLVTVIERLATAARDGHIPQENVAETILLLRSLDAVPEEEQKNELIDRREQILSVAAKTFAKHGFHGTKLQLIADEVGVTRPSFYYHFKSKQDILAAIYESGMARTETMIDRVLALDLAPREKLRTFIVEYIKVNAPGSEVSMMFRTFHELAPKTQREFALRRTAIDHRLVAVIQEGVYQGVFRTRAPLITLLGILGAINGMHNWYRPEGSLSLEEISTIFIELFFDGVEVVE